MEMRSLLRTPRLVMLAVLILGAGVLGWWLAASADAPLPPDKAAVVSRELALRQVSPAPKISPPPVPDSHPQPWPQGLHPYGGSTNGNEESCEVPGTPALEYDFQNCWYQIINGQHVVFLAGAEDADATQGVVAVWHVDTSDFHVYLTPSAAGSIHVLGIDGDDLKLVGQTGTPFRFNIQTFTFD